MLNKIKSIVNGWLNYILPKRRKRTQLLFDYRYEFCSSCVHKKVSKVYGEFCGKCYCPLKSKLRDTTEDGKCPIGKF